MTRISAAMSSRRPPEARRTLEVGVAHVALAALLIVATGCGKKGPPLPPLRWEPAAITDLVARQQGDVILIESTYPVTTLSGLPLAAISAVEVFRLEVPIPPMPAPPTEEELAALALEREEEEIQAEEDEADRLAARSVLEASEFEEDPAIEALIEAGRGASEIDGEIDDPAEGSSDEASASASEPATSSPGERPLPPISDREFERKAGSVARLEELELASAIRGSRLTLEVPLSMLQEGDDVLLGIGMRTFNDEGKPSPMSNIVKVVPLVPYGPPSGVRLESRENGIQISWTGPDEIPDGYNVYRRRSEDPNYSDPIRRIDAPQASVPASSPTAPSSTEADSAPATVEEGSEIEESDREEDSARQQAAEAEVGEVATAVPDGDPEPGTDGNEIQDPSLTAPEVTEPAAAEPKKPPVTQMFDEGASYGQRYVYTVRSFRAGEPLIESVPADEVEIDYRDVFPPLPPTGCWCCRRTWADAFYGAPVRRPTSWAISSRRSTATVRSGAPTKNRRLDSSSSSRAWSVAASTTSG